MNRPQERSVKNKTKTYHQNKNEQDNGTCIIRVKNSKAGETVHPLKTK